MTIASALLAVGIAFFLFHRAWRGHCDGRARLDVRGFSLDADQEDDPVGFSTAVGTNVAMGAFALLVAAWLIWIRPGHAAPTAADVERARWCIAPDAASPGRQVRNLSGRSNASGTMACTYEEVIGTGHFISMRARFGWDRRTASWCFANGPEPM